MNRKVLKKIRRGTAFRQWKSRLTIVSIGTFSYIFLGFAIIALLFPNCYKPIFLTGILIVIYMGKRFAFDYNWKCPNCERDLPSTESRPPSSPFAIKYPNIVEFCPYCNYDLKQNKKDLN